MDATSSRLDTAESHRERHHTRIPREVRKFFQRGAPSRRVMQGEPGWKGGLRLRMRQPLPLLLIPRQRESREFPTSDRVGNAGTDRVRTGRFPHYRTRTIDRKGCMPVATEMTNGECSRFQYGVLRVSGQAPSGLQVIRGLQIPGRRLEPAGHRYVSSAGNAGGPVSGTPGHQCQNDCGAPAWPESSGH